MSTGVNFKPLVPILYDNRFQGTLTPPFKATPIEKLIEVMFALRVVGSSLNLLWAFAPTIGGRYPEIQPGSNRDVE